MARRHISEDTQGRTERPTVSRAVTIGFLFRRVPDEIHAKYEKGECLEILALLHYPGQAKHGSLKGLDRHQRGFCSVAPAGPSNPHVGWRGLHPGLEGQARQEGPQGMPETRTLSDQLGNPIPSHFPYHERSGPKLPKQVLLEPGLLRALQKLRHGDQHGPDCLDELGETEDSLWEVLRGRLECFQHGAPVGGPETSFRFVTAQTHEADQEVQQSDVTLFVLHRLLAHAGEVSPRHAGTHLRRGVGGGQTVSQVIDIHLKAERKAVHAQERLQRAVADGWRRGDQVPEALHAIFPKGVGVAPAPGGAPQVFVVRSICSERGAGGAATCGGRRHVDIQQCV